MPTRNFKSVRHQHIFYSLSFGTHALFLHRTLGHTYFMLKGQLNQQNHTFLATKGMNNAASSCSSPLHCIQACLFSNVNNYRNHA